jgi:hypothetical protein
MMIWLDCDGVLADLNTHYENLFGVRPPPLQEWTPTTKDVVDWKKVTANREFFLTMPMMPDAHELIEFAGPLGACVLTGVPSSVTEAENHKRTWLRKVAPGLPVVCCPSKLKWTYCLPGDIIVDDWQKYRVDWERAGGVFIHHHTAADSIRELRQCLEHSSSHGCLPSSSA